MTDNIRSLRGAHVPPPEAIDAWHAAIAAALGGGCAAC